MRKTISVKAENPRYERKILSPGEKGVQKPKPSQQEKKTLKRMGGERSDARSVLERDIKEGPLPRKNTKNRELRFPEPFGGKGVYKKTRKGFTRGAFRAKKEGGGDGLSTT